METAVIVLMALVLFNFVLKLSFLHIRETMTLAVVALLVVALSWPLAIEQSRTQIADWLNNQQQMLDTAVLLTVDTALQLVFCFSMAGELAGEAKNNKQKVRHMLLTYFPGLTVFIVLFSLLVWVIFAFPGTDFQLVAWALGTAIAIAIPCLSYLTKWMLPEKDIRLELLFIGNIATGILCIVTTVNGKTAVTGNTEIDWKSLLLVASVTLAGAAAGMAIRHIRQNRKH